MHCVGVEGGRLCVRDCLPWEPLEGLDAHERQL
jgi:hypothetical protein